MTNQDIKDKILEVAIENWNRSFGGTSALEIRSRLNTSNEIIMAEMENLERLGKGTVNKNIELIELEVNPETNSVEFHEEATVTHMFFPSPTLLEDFFYDSGMARKDIPEYKKRLHCGAHQLSLVFFSEKVLSKYYTYQEYYTIEDSHSGGSIRSKPDTPEEHIIYIRHGKKKLNNSTKAVTAIYKDLYSLSPEEQRHWHAHEINPSDSTTNDTDFEKFLARTYAGAFVEFDSPIDNVYRSLSKINITLKEIPELNGRAFYNKTWNDHLRPPVENNLSTFNNCCSELYKLVGHENIDQKIVKNILTTFFGFSKNDFIHKESERNLSTTQLLQLMEDAIHNDRPLTGTLDKIRVFRVEAAHKITSNSIGDNNYNLRFYQLCEEFTESLGVFLENLSDKILNNNK